MHACMYVCICITCITCTCVRSYGLQILQSRLDESSMIARYLQNGCNEPYLMYEYAQGVHCTVQVDNKCTKYGVDCPHTTHPNCSFVLSESKNGSSKHCYMYST